VKAETGGEAAGEKFEASRRWFMKFKERSCFCIMKVQDEAAGADIEAATSDPEDLAQIINIGVPTLSHFLFEEDAI